MWGIIAKCLFLRWSVDYAGHTTTAFRALCRMILQTLSAPDNIHAQHSNKTPVTVSPSATMGLSNVLLLYVWIWPAWENVISVLPFQIFLALFWSFCACKVKILAKNLKLVVELVCHSNCPFYSWKLCGFSLSFKEIMWSGLLSASYQWKSENFITSETLWANPLKQWWKWHLTGTCPDCPTSQALYDPSLCICHIGAYTNNSSLILLHHLSSWPRHLLFFYRSA